MVTWDSGDFHYFADVENDGPLTCQYVFVMDALNFCFWPTDRCGLSTLCNPYTLLLV